MELFLQILGGFGLIVLVVIVVAVIAVLVFIAKIKKALSEFGECEGGIQRIHLQPCTVFKWKDVDAVEKAQKAFEKRGLQNVGVFLVDEMPKLTLNAFVKADEGLIGVIYEMEPVGQWTDFCKYYEGGNSITVTNTKVGQELRQREGHRKVRLVGENVDAMIEELRKNDLGGKPHPMDETPSGFTALFEKAYADEMDWRNSLGGPSEEEIRDIAANSGIEADESSIEITHLLKKLEACEGLNIAFAERYCAKKSLSESSWTELSSRIIFVHDRLPQELLDQVFEEHGILLPEDTVISEILKEQTAREAFESINQRLEHSSKFRKIDTLDEPLPADVYERSIS